MITIIPMVNASILSSKDITFSVNQKDYYFKTGEEAIIPLNIENTYGKDINGKLTYTYTQTTNQGGMSMSSTNSQSISFSTKDGETTQKLNFGTSNNPSELNVKLKFTYTENEQRIVNLDGITIHFVSDENQKQNQENKQSASSETYSQTQQQNSNQDPLSQMQQQINQMMNNNNNYNNQQTQDPKQALQNNQMSQDSSALKKQMENQIKEQEKNKEELQKELAKNENFQKEHKELLDQGYNLTNANFNPSSNNTGDFKLDYKKPNGEEASLSGNINKGKVENLKKDTPETRQKMLDELEQNKKFQQYEKKLQKEGFSKNNSEITQQQNKTNIKIEYKNKNNETASINTEIVNNTIKNIDLKQPTKQTTKIAIPLIIATIVLILSFLIYKKLNKKQPTNTTKQKLKPIVRKINYKLESKKLIEKAKKLFEEKKYKDAYGTAGQALRLFLSYENNLNKEITNDEIIKYLKQKQKEHKQIKECFDLCSLVEFAKYETNKKDFDKIISKTEQIINEK